MASVKTLDREIILRDVPIGERTYNPSGLGLQGKACNRSFTLIEQSLWRCSDAFRGYRPCRPRCPPAGGRLSGCSDLTARSVLEGNYESANNSYGTTEKLNLAWRIHYTLVTPGAVSVVWWYFNWKTILGKRDTSISVRSAGIYRSLDNLPKT